MNIYKVSVTVDVVVETESTLNQFNLGKICGHLERELKTQVEKTIVDDMVPDDDTDHVLTTMVEAHASDNSPKRGTDT